MNRTKTNLLLAMALAMVRLKLIWLFTAALVAGPLAALAFRDDFDGEQLGQNWTLFSESGFMHYTVGNGLLTVDHIEGGGDFNGVFIVTRVDRYPGPFEMRARLGWDEAQQSEIDLFALTGAPPPVSDVAQMSAKKLQGEAFRTLSWGLNGHGGNAGRIPEFGFHDFLVVRDSQSFRAYFDGALIGTAAPGTGVVTNIAIAFGGPADQRFAPLYADYIEIVPEPASLLGITLFSVAFYLRRRARLLAVRREYSPQR